MILATGRDRNWPTTPLATTYGQYMLEMDNARQEIANADTISVIGAGAVGIEFAGDIKTEFPHKTVNLIHPHECFPQEPLSMSLNGSHRTRSNEQVSMCILTRESEPNQ